MKQLLPQTLRSAVWRALYTLRDASLQVIVSGATTQKLVALTFDDGPTPDFTPQVLAALAQHQIPATFFMIGQFVMAHPQIAQQVVQAGHAIGNHTFSHAKLAGLGVQAVVDEVQHCQDVLRSQVQVNPNLLRPPFGLRDVRGHIAMRVLGFDLVNWSASGEDWRGDPPEAIAAHVLNEVQPGSIVLLHDGCGALRPDGNAQPVSTDRTPTVQALPLIIAPLRQQGYRFVTVPQLLKAAPAVRRAWF